MPEPLFQDDEGRNVYSVGEGSSTYTVEELSQNFLEEACSILSETPNPDWSKMGQVSLSWDIELYESKLSDAGYFVDWCDGFVIREALTDEEIAYVDDEGDFGDDQVTEQLEAKAIHLARSEHGLLEEFQQAERELRLSGGSDG